MHCVPIRVAGTWIGAAECTGQIAVTISGSVVAALDTSGAVVLTEFANVDAVAAAALRSKTQQGEDKAHQAHHRCW